MACRTFVCRALLLLSDDGDRTNNNQLTFKTRLVNSPGFYQKRKKKPCLARTGQAFVSFLEYDLESLQEFLSAVPNTSAITILAVALTAVGSSVVYNEKKTSKIGLAGSGTRQKTSGSWFLTLNPTPFNKFVIARCPSIGFNADSAVDEDVHHKLSLESHQVVTLQNGRLEFSVETASMDYQRKCIPVEDGGVLALDWPTSLDLEGDHGLDTTVMVVPGTVRGSEDETVKVFVQRALKAGYFPVVLNPRGCGKSPLTTPRLFSAGDSDDIRAAVSYLSRSRPWTTLMGIAWGYGANMLTKYLGEEENLTPLTAAVSVNNPFDLAEATKLMKTNPKLHEEMTDGFVEILKSNKMIFQGQRDVDVAGGLIATSVREFETAISIPANGFRTLDSFYKAASSGNFVDHVKTPLLCLQDSSFAPLYSIPQTVFERNPYTTLLYTPLESKSVSGNLIINSALEWLAAVEIALLKGRHPLLREFDLTVKPSKEWSTNIGSDLIEVDPNQDDGTSVSKSWLLENVSANSSAKQEQPRSESTDNSRQQDTSEANVTEEQGQVLQAAKTVFGALDVAMPGTLSDETKEQVLDAVSRGESIITALQNAVPEDVRGKMATAVSAAVQARGMSLQMVGFGQSFPPPTLPAGLKESIQEKLSSVAKMTKEGSDGQESKLEPSSKPHMTDPNSKLEQSAEGVSEVHTDAVAPGAPAVTDEKPESHDGDKDSKLESHDTDKDSKLQTENSGMNQEASQRSESIQPTATSELKSGAENTSEGNVNSLQRNTSCSMNVQHAFQALTGLDDSTQMAVNNVFGVLEGMLEQIERDKQDDFRPDLANRHMDFQREPAALPVEVSNPVPQRQTSQLRTSTSTDLKNQEQSDELMDVQSRLKKTRISGFILHDDKVPMKGEAVPAADFCRTRTMNVLLEAMKVEVQRRVGAGALEASAGLKEELSQVADAVVKEVQNVRVYNDSSSRKVLSAEGLVNAVALVFRDSTMLKQVIPFGVLVGIVLASLVSSFVVVTGAEASWQHMEIAQSSTPVTITKAATKTENGTPRSSYGNVVGAVTAAMGATAALASTGNNDKEGDESDDDDSYKDSIVANIADKAFSIAAPVVPTKDGQVDHERLVSMLTDISQKAGFLNVLGKAALLWGGLRGAMSLTDRLLVFLRINERPLHQRLLGFVGMTMLLWSPVFVPLLPSLLTEWTAQSSAGVAQCASVAGLYGALVILVVIWGKKIRGYEQPLQSYGLKLKKLKFFGPGVAAGCAVVSFFYCTLSLLGYMKFVPSFLLGGQVSQLALSAVKLLKLIIEGTIIGLGISFVEELLFRSWLVEEIAVDLGQQTAILLSGLLFALIHRTPSGIPGHWLLGIALSGARFKAAGNLALPIGLHTGLMAANFVYNCGGFIVYSSAPNWITGVHAGTPLAGALGAAMAGIFALLLYPWNLLREPDSMVTVT